MTDNPNGNGTSTRTRRRFAGSYTDLRDKFIKVRSRLAAIHLMILGRPIEHVEAVATQDGVCVAFVFDRDAVALALAAFYPAQDRAAARA